MKKLIVVIIIVAISMFAGYKLYGIVNKPEQFGNDRVGQFIKSDVMGEIESISESEIILKVIKSPIPNKNKDNKESNIKSDFKIEYTDEKKNITICADMKIFKNIINEKGIKDYEINNVDLKVGDVLSLTYNEDKSSIDKIVLVGLK